MLISLIVPCYNEEESLPHLYNALCEVRDSEDCRDKTFEFIFVNDGSSDKTAELIKEYASSDTCVRYVMFSRNFGKESAMYAGLQKAKGDYVAIMDADMQDPPSLIPDMIRSLDADECDIVAARRVTREGEPKIRSFFARAFYRLINRMCDVEIADGARDFRLMRRSSALLERHLCLGRVQDQVDRACQHTACGRRDQVELLEAFPLRD